ncbi:MAG: hypothetical protein ACKPKO_16210, partial [Candidatus Fonsibacter sp.]
MRHPNDWTEIRFVLWLLQDEAEYVQHEVHNNHDLETDSRIQASPASRLSTITEEPSNLTEETLFRHDEPVWEQFDTAASLACLQCATYGQEQPVHTPGDECEATWLQLKDLQGDNGDALDTQSLVVHSTNLTEDSLELYYTADMSKLAYRGHDGDRLVDVDFPGPGEHLCV